MGSDLTLLDLFNTGNYPTDKGTLHSYIPFYDLLFSKFKYKSINVLEVGIQFGFSIKLWAEYFPNATIFGYDIIDSVTEVLPNNIKKTIKNANQITDHEFHNSPLTIAIDDGSHLINDQLNFVKNIYPQIISGGILIIEDIADIESNKKHFDNLNIPYSIIDMRNIKNRYDDVLIIFIKP